MCSAQNVWSCCIIQINGVQTCSWRQDTVQQSLAPTLTNTPDPANQDIRLISHSTNESTALHTLCLLYFTHLIQIISLLGESSIN